MAGRPIRTFGFSKPHPSEVVSGDAWVTLPMKDGLRVALVDGAGHGELASQAAARAISALSDSVDRPLDSALALCHQALHNTRGAAVSAADIDGNRIAFGGIGNVEGRLITPRREHRLVPQRGIAGVVVPRLRLEGLDLPDESWAIALHSDGISQRFKAPWQAIVASPDHFVQDVIGRWGRLTDDATLLLVLSEKA